MAGNVVNRGRYRDQAETLTGLVNGALLPATFVTFDGTDFNQATTGAGSRLFVLNMRDFYTQTITDAYEDNETGQAYRAKPDEEYTVAFAAGTYAYGAELMVAASGRLAAATSTNLVVAWFDQPGATLAAGDLADVAIANAYIKA